VTTTTITIVCPAGNTSIVFQDGPEANTLTYRGVVLATMPPGGGVALATGVALLEGGLTRSALEIDEVVYPTIEIAPGTRLQLLQLSSLEAAKLRAACRGGYIPWSEWTGPYVLLEGDDRSHPTESDLAQDTGW